MRHEPASVLITGASGGIGRALALAYAGPGSHLHLCGRNRVRLDDTAQACREAGAVADGVVLDVRDRHAMADWITACAARAPLDLVIANAGISGGAGTTASTGDDNHNRDSDADSNRDADMVRAIFDINLGGVLNTLDPAIAAMRRAGGGQIAVMSSLAGYRGMPGAPAYSAAKAAVLCYGEALRGALAGENIGVSVICPGFVRSAITDANTFPMPFLMPAGRAAGIIRRALRRNPARIAFPWQMALLMRVMAMLSAATAIRLLTRLPKKGDVAGD